MRAMGVRVLFISELGEPIAGVAEASREIPFILDAQPTLKAASLLAQDPFDLVLLDISRAEAPCWSLLEQLSEEYADVPFVVLGPNDPGSLRRAMSLGASDYLDLPLTKASLGHAIELGLAHAQVRADRAGVGATRLGLIGASPPMMAVHRIISQVAPESTTVLIRGESGTGKELVARAIHEKSGRQGPFIAVHAAAIPETLLESELFGFEKGAFTNADKRKPGRIAVAEGGTLFLDEVGDIPPSIQVKLLRLIQERTYEPLGTNQTKRANVRVLAATHRDLDDLRATGKFREDLYQRLNVVQIWLAPLRARREDIALIARRYFAIFASNAGTKLRLTEGAVQALKRNRWPGNARELANFMERLVVIAPGDEVTEADVLSNLNQRIAFLTQSSVAANADEAVAPAPAPDSPDNGRGKINALDQISEVRSLAEEVRRAELKAINKALHHAKGNRALAARLLGISRRTLYTKLSEHDIV